MTMHPHLPLGTPRRALIPAELESQNFVFVPAVANPNDAQLIAAPGKDERISIRRQAAKSGSRRRRLEEYRNKLTGSAGAAATASTLPAHLANGEGPGVGVGVADAATGMAPIIPASYFVADTGVVDLRHCEKKPQELVFSISQTPTLSGYERMRMKYDIDLISLDGLTDADVGRVASHLLQRDPHKLAGLLHQQGSSYLSLLPRRYGFSVCLDDAMHCVAARAAQMMRPGQVVGKEGQISWLYIKALRSLRAALQDKNQRLGADVFGATQLLSIFEVLSPTDNGGWIQHQRGAAKLIELRGPDNFKDEFDILLFKAIARSIPIENLFRNRANFFEHPKWIQFFQARAEEDRADLDKSLWWNLYMPLCYISRLVRDVKAMFEAQSIPHHKYVECQYELLDRAGKIHSIVHSWHMVYEAKATERDPEGLLPNTLAESPDRKKLRGMTLYTIMCINRILCSLDVCDLERRVACEQEAQALADQAIALERIAANRDPAMKWHLEQRNCMSHAIRESRQEWAFDLLSMNMPWRDKKCFLGTRWLNWNRRWKELAGIGWKPEWEDE